MKTSFRLDKYLADMSVGTRSEVKNLIKKGLVTVNGEVIRKPEYKVDIEKDDLVCRGEPVVYQTLVYYILNKPAGVISATNDPKQKTVMDLITDKSRKDFTNDGDLAHQLLSPKKHVDKVYCAVIDGQVTEEDVDLFAKGLEIDDEDGAWRAMPAKLNILSSGPESEVEITIREGKFHQIKRMFEAVDKKVVYLKRLSMGSLRLDETLALGEYRELTEDEVQALKESKGHTNDEE